MTREEKRQRKKQNRLTALCFVILLIWAACLLCSYAGASFGERVCTVTGAWTWAWILTRFISWLDKPKKGRGQ